MNQAKISPFFQNLENLVLRGVVNDDFFKVNDFNMILKIESLYFLSQLKGTNWNELSNLQSINLIGGNYVRTVDQNQMPIFGNNIFSTNHFPSLKSIEFCKLFQFEIGKNWKIFPNLKTIDCLMCNLTNELFQDIVRFPNLEKLRIEKNNKTTELGKYWAVFPKLKDFSVTDVNLSDEPFQDIVRFPNLERLYINNSVIGKKTQLYNNLLKKKNWIKLPKIKKMSVFTGIRSNIKIMQLY